MYNNPVIKTRHQKHLGLILDENLNFREHLKEKMLKAYKGIGVLRKLQNIVPRNFVLITYTPLFIRSHTTPFIRPHLDYRHNIYHQSHNGSYYQKSKSIQYQEALAMAGAIH